MRGDRCRPRYETRTAPTHALCISDNDVFSDPSSNSRGERMNPSIHDVRLPPPGRSQERKLVAFRDRSICSGPGGGGARRDRTDDLMLAKHALYQLSYGPLTKPGSARAVVRSFCPPEVSHEVWWAQADSNCRPHAYQACALTT